MAEDLDLGADQDDLLADPPEETEASAEEMTEDGTAEDATDRFAEDEPPAEDAEAQKWHKHWQAAYTKTRQKDRERAAKLTEEHERFKGVLQNFWGSDEYALQVVRQRFPQLAGKLSLDGTPTQPGTPTGANGKLIQVLQQKLGADLAFLAQPLADAMQAAVGDAMAPERESLQRERKEEQAQARKQKELELYADMDTKYPGWEDRYGEEMQALDQFLASDALSHPKYGHKYELLYRLLNRDQGRIDAARGMQQAARARIGTGRTGRPAEANVGDRVAKAATNSEAFRLAAEAALEELGR